MTPRLALVHTVASLAPAFDALCDELLPGVERAATVDESLLRDAIAAGGLVPAIRDRLAGTVAAAVRDGATAVLVTCSSMGPAVDELARTAPVPVWRVDEAMADEAVAIGPRVGVLATLRTTLEPTADLVRRRASLAGRSVEVDAVIVDGAFDALTAGDRHAHDEAVGAALVALAGRVDAVVLAQASMARLADAVHALPVPVLASPRPGISLVARRLGVAPVVSAASAVR